MRRFFSTSVLLLTASFFLFTAWSSGFAPREFAARLGLSIISVDGYNEIRAQYAGFFLVTAGICIAALAGAVPRKLAFAIVTIIFGGLFAGRAVSVVLNRGVAGYGPAIRALNVIDGAGLLLAFSALINDRPLLGEAEEPRPTHNIEGR